MCRAKKEENNGAAPLRSVSGEVFATFASLLLVALVLMCMLQTGLSCAYFAQERKSALTAVLDGATAMAETYASEGNIVTLPGGQLYLNDVVICTASILLDPFAAFVVGGIGAFLGDFFFYPTPMFVSLVTHGLQAVVISLCAHHLFQKKPMIGAGIGVLLGAIIMVVGYSLGRAFIYSTVEYALLKLPFQILQAAVGAIVAMVLCFARGLALRFDKICGIQ